MKGGPESLNYQVSQILTGDTCFVKYLHRNDSDSPPLCMEYVVGKDSALHTLVECVAFDAQLCDLRDAVGRSLSQ